MWKCGNSVLKVYRLGYSFVVNELCSHFVTPPLIAVMNSWPSSSDVNVKVTGKGQRFSVCVGECVFSCDTDPKP